jgi:hypothetical protein
VNVPEAVWVKIGVPVIADVPVRVGVTVSRGVLVVEKLGVKVIVFTKVAVDVDVKIGVLVGESGAVPVWVAVERIVLVGVEVGVAVMVMVSVIVNVGVLEELPVGVDVSVLEGVEVSVGCLTPGSVGLTLKGLVQEIAVKSPKTENRARRKLFFIFRPAFSNPKPLPRGLFRNPKKRI